MGWGLARHLAQKHRVHVLAHAAHRAATEAYLNEHSEMRSSLTFSYFGKPRPYYSHGIRSLLVQFEYHHWQTNIARWAAPVIKEFAPDVVHHATLVRYWTPSSLANLDLPFIFGPVGGADRTPQGLSGTYSHRSRLAESVRTRVQSLFEAHPKLRATLRRAALAIATTQETAGRMRGIGASRVEVLGESALSAADLQLLDGKVAAPGEFFVVSARLLHWKGVHLTLAAFAEVLKTKPAFRLEVFGEGAERTRLQALAASLGISDQVVWHGSRPRAEYLARLRASRALVHASLHDSGGWVCVEAMAAGIPVVCLNVGGPATQVTPQTGFVVEPGSPGETVARLTNAMLSLCADDEIRSAMGAAGRARVAAHYTWEKRVERFTEIYEEAIRTHASRRAR